MTRIRSTTAASSLQFPWDELSQIYKVQPSKMASVLGFIKLQIFELILGTTRLLLCRDIKGKSCWPQSCSLLVHGECRQRYLCSLCAADVILHEDHYTTRCRIPSVKVSADGMKDLHSIYGILNGYSLINQMFDFSFFGFGLLRFYPLSIHLSIFLTACLIQGPGSLRVLGL